MQHRMKTHMLTKEAMDQLLVRSATGSLSTLNSDGSPYVIPVHYLYHNGAIYIHGLPKGQKLDNIKADSRVSMAIYEMEGLLLDPEGKPCDTNTKYQSVIFSGKAALLEDVEQELFSRRSSKNIHPIWPPPPCRKTWLRERRSLRCKSLI
ncbi:MAG: pyridoxamine 5'-phosphate oxidase family protein [Clostridiales bacterium]